MKREFWLVELMWRYCQLSEKRRKRSDVTSTLRPADFLRNVWKYCRRSYNDDLYFVQRNTAAFIPRADFTRLFSAISESSFLSSCSAAVVCFNIRSDMRGGTTTPRVHFIKKASNHRASSSVECAANEPAEAQSLAWNIQQFGSVCDRFNNRYLHSNSSWGSWVL